MPDSSYPDNEACFFLSISNSAEHESKVDTARLLQLVLGIAINCDRKDSKSDHHMCDSGVARYRMIVVSPFSLHPGHYVHAAGSATCGDGGNSGGEYYLEA